MGILSIRIVFVLPAILSCRVSFADFDITDFSAPPIGLSFPTTTSGQPNTAVVEGTLLQLTPGTLSNRGIVWTSLPQNLGAGFTTTFEFEFVGGTGAGGSADGLAFVIQNESVDAYGDHAGAMGYGGFLVSPDNGITNSVAVEFDDFANGNFADPDGNHISVHTLFAASNSTDETTASIGSVTPPPFGQFTGTHIVMISYIDGELSIFMDDMVTPQLTVALDLEEVLGGASGWIGFTGSGGSAYQVENVLNWSFVEAPTSGGDPDFSRGDLDGDGAVVGLIDGLFLLNFGFNGGATPPCMAAADVNADRTIGALIDGLALLNYAFNGGAPPPAPGPTCGPDPNGINTLGCVTSPCP